MIVVDLEAFGGLATTKMILIKIICYLIDLLRDEVSLYYLNINEM